MTRTGDQLGAYELLRPLGAGGMAETFVAIRRGPAGFEQRVCLKRILPGCAADPLFVELFLDEARLLARLQCANIVHVYDFGEVAGTYYMALELIDGVDLEGLLTSLRQRGERMPEAIALYIITELLVALRYAHTLEIDGEPQGIVHRDISPSNVLLSKTGEVKLTDFGIAKSRGRSHRTQAGHTKGKVAYMSPEQMRAEELDGRSDLFAVGVVLFELLTLSHPFDANTDYALQVNIMTGKRKPLRELLPRASERLVKLVDALLATSRDARPETAADALELIPQLESPFSLQRGLEALVKQCLGTKGSAASSARTASVPRPAPAQLASGYSDAAQATATPAAAPAVTARGTTAGAPSRSQRKPALWAALLLLVLGLGLGAALTLQRRAELAKDAPAAPASERPVGAGLTPPAIPSAPAPSGARGAPEPAPAASVPSVHIDSAAAAHAPPAAAAIPAARVPMTQEEQQVHAEHEQRRMHKHGEHQHAAGEPAVTREPTSTAEAAHHAPALSPSGQAPALAAPADPAAPGPTLAPRSEDARPSTPRATYVTPSGRVVIAAPPL
ncbi:MAG: serine/threonine protein kinase [Myxococcaceae bacterium]|nr:serine/threonine protein kinase [Myxococcaceae bacterium]